MKKTSRKTAKITFFAAATELLVFPIVRPKWLLGSSTPSGRPYRHLWPRRPLYEVKNGGQENLILRFKSCWHLQSILIANGLIFLIFSRFWPSKAAKNYSIAGLSGGPYCLSSAAQRPWRSVVSLNKMINWNSKVFAWDCGNGGDGKKYRICGHFFIAANLQGSFPSFESFF